VNQSSTSSTSSPDSRELQDKDLSLELSDIADLADNGSGKHVPLFVVVSIAAIDNLDVILPGHFLLWGGVSLERLDCSLPSEASFKSGFIKANGIYSQSPKPESQKFQLLHDSATAQ
jgi:hypothetical protein